MKYSNKLLNEEIMFELEKRKEQEKKYTDSVLKQLKAKNNDIRIKEELDKLYNSINNIILKLKMQSIIKKYKKLNENSKLELMYEIVVNIIESNILLNKEKNNVDLESHKIKVMDDYDRKDEIIYYKTHNNEMYLELLKDTFSDILIRINSLNKDDKINIVQNIQKGKK